MPTRDAVKKKAGQQKCGYCKATDHVYKDCDKAKLWKAGKAPKGTRASGKQKRTKFKMLKGRLKSGRMVVRLVSSDEQLDQELRAMDTCFKILQPLPGAMQTRVLQWVQERLNLQGVVINLGRGKATR